MYKYNKNSVKLCMQFYNNDKKNYVEWELEGIKSFSFSHII